MIDSSLSFLLYIIYNLFKKSTCKCEFFSFLCMPRVRSVLLNYFINIFPFQFFHQIRIAHTVHIRYTIPEQRIYFRMIKKFPAHIFMYRKSFSSSVFNSIIYLHEMHPYQGTLHWHLILPQCGEAGCISLHARISKEHLS